jgi:hypothetical protein
MGSACNSCWCDVVPMLFHDDISREGHAMKGLLRPLLDIRCTVIGRVEVLQAPAPGTWLCGQRETRRQTIRRTPFPAGIAHISPIIH